MYYLFINDKARVYEAGSLEDELRRYKRDCLASIDCWDSADTIKQAVENAANSGLNITIADDNFNILE